MNIIIYRHDIKQPKDRSQFERILTLAIKSIILFAIPLLFSAPVTWIWYRYLYGRGINFDNGMEAIITTAWIPTFAVLYGLVSSKVLDTVWSEYKAMREAMKEGTRGITKFVKVRDERVSPLIYMVIVVLSGSILTAFMVVKYPCLLGGFCTVASTSYLFALIVWIIVEIDNPCGGLWFIHRMPNSWMMINTGMFHEKFGKLPNDKRENIEILEKLIKECQLKSK